MSRWGMFYISGTIYEAYIQHLNTYFPFGSRLAFPTYQYQYFRVLHYRY